MDLEISWLIENLGAGYIESVPYDTAWLARLSLDYPEFGSAMDWLRMHQHVDGSWGSEILHYHDRFICTLNAIIALSSTGNPDDQRRVEQGIRYLWENYANLARDEHDTVAFPVLSGVLVKDALDMGLKIPLRIRSNPAEVSAKLRIIGQQTRLWRHHTMSHSLEACREYIHGDIDFLEENGSVGVSPAATAAILTSHYHEDAMRYLQRVVTKQGDGGLSDVDPIDIFEITWALNYLRVGNTVVPDMPGIKRHIDFLANIWSAGRGAGFSSFYSVPDLDDTALVFTILAWAGRSPDYKIFEAFEEENHFRCFPYETNPSLSSHLHLLMALKMVGQEHSPLAIKALTQIQRWKNNGQVWFDKWHASPYYLSVPIVEALAGLDDELIEERIQWLLATQRPDGSWGYFYRSTLEETSYALLALLACMMRGYRIDPIRIHRAAQYLVRFRDDINPPLWIGKCLYTPYFVVRAVRVAALYRYYAWKDDTAYAAAD